MHKIAIAWCLFCALELMLTTLDAWNGSWEDGNNNSCFSKLVYVITSQAADCLFTRTHLYAIELGACWRTIQNGNWGTGTSGKWKHLLLSRIELGCQELWNCWFYFGYKAFGDNTKINACLEPQNGGENEVLWENESMCNHHVLNNWFLDAFELPTLFMRFMLLQLGLDVKTCIKNWKVKS